MPQAQIGFAVRSSGTHHHELNIRRQLLIPKLKSRHGGPIMLSATENESMLEDMLDKFNAPLDFRSFDKKDSTSSDISKDATSSAKNNDGGESSDKAEDSSPSQTKAVSSSTPSSSTSSEKVVAPSALDKPTNIATFAPSADTPLATKYYNNLMGISDQAKNTEMTAEKTSTPPPVSSPRRRFTDFGIASEQAEPSSGKEVTAEETSTITEEPKSTNIFRGFTDFSIQKPSQATAVKIDSENTEIGTTTKQKPLFDFAKPLATKTETIKPQDAKDVENAKSSSASVVKCEENTDSNAFATKLDKHILGGTASSTANKEKPVEREVSTAKEQGPTETKAATKGENDPSTATSNTIKEEKAPSVAHTIKEEKTTPSPAATTATTPTSSELIQTQPASPTNTVTFPNINLDAEDFGVLTLVIIGISVYFSLGVYLKQVNQNDKGYAGWDDLQKKDERGLVGKAKDKVKNRLQQIKDAGVAGAISYALWEAAFWGVSIPICLASYFTVTGHWPDLTNVDDRKQIGLEAFAFVNFARLAVPIRIGLALSTVPFVEENILTLFKNGEEEDVSSEVVPTEEDVAAEMLDSQRKNVIAAATEKEQAEAKANLDEGDINSNRVEYPEEEYYTGDQSYNMYDESYGYSDDAAVSEMEERLRSMEAEMANLKNSGIDPTLLEYCEPGQIDDDCTNEIQGYLDSLASTGAVATEDEVARIVGYLDSLSSNVAPNEKTGAAFTTYLDALSSGYVAPPASAKAVAKYLDVLSDPSEQTEEDEQQTKAKIGSRINEVEDRLSRLESSVSSLPDDIASRLVDWQISQDKRVSDEMEKIMKLLVDGKSLNK